MKSKAILLLLFLSFLLYIPTVHADMGPKPGVIIEVNGIENDEVYYGAFIADDKEILHAAYSESYNAKHEDYEIYLKFREYADPQNLNFHDSLWKLQGNNEFAWHYYAPNHFRILLYFPSSDSFLLSDEYSRYTFKSHFTIDLEGKNINELDSIQLKSNKYSLYALEFVSFLVRMALTILIELYVAKAYSLINQKEKLIIIALNIITQIYLNTTLAIHYINSGPFLFFIFYFIVEFKVFLLEMISYILLIPKISLNSIKKRKIISYTLTANIFSFLTGALISIILPGIY